MRRRPSPPVTVPSPALRGQVDAEIRLDAVDYVELPGDTIRWRWRVVERPPGSWTECYERFAPRSELPDSALTPVALVRPDTPGRYVVELSVANAVFPCTSVARVPIVAD